MNKFKNDGIIGRFKAQLPVQENMEDEVYDKISIASKSARVLKENVTQV